MTKLPNNTDFITESQNIIVQTDKIVKKDVCSHMLQRLIKFSRRKPQISCLERNNLSGEEDGVSIGSG